MRAAPDGFHRLAEAHVRAELAEVSSMLAMLKNWATRLIANVMAVIHRYITGETIMSADQQQHHRLTATALITEAPDIMSATVKTRTNYAVPHLLSAAIFSRRLGEIEAEHSGQDFGPFWDEILAHASATVFLAVAGLESYANELFIDMNQSATKARAPSL
jgi:hypothetical protein